MPASGIVIGEVVNVTGEAFAENGGEVRSLEAGAPIFKGDSLVTGDDSNVEVQFQDDSLMSQAANGRTLLDDYVYDPDDAAGSQMLFKLAEGSMRMVTGKIAESNPDGVHMESPLAVIGIRGTTVTRVFDHATGNEQWIAEELTGGHSILFQDSFGNIQVVTFDLGGVDFAPGRPMGTVYVVPMSDLIEARGEMPLTSRGEPPMRPRRGPRPGDEEGSGEADETGEDTGEDGEGEGEGEGTGEDTGEDQGQGEGQGEGEELGQEEQGLGGDDDGDTGDTGDQPSRLQALTQAVAEQDVLTADEAAAALGNLGLSGAVVQQIVYGQSTSQTGTQDALGATEDLTGDDDDDDVVNQLPVAAKATAQVAEDGAVSGQVVATDADEEALTYSVKTAPANGSVSMAHDGTFIYVPDADFNGTDSFTYQVKDGSGGTATATVTVTVDAVNDAPEAGDVAGLTNAGDALSGSLDGSDIDGDTLTYTLATDAANGTVTVDAGGTYQYVPAQGFFGTDSFTYTVTDPSGESATATVTVTVNAEPVAQNGTASGDEDTVITGTLSAADADGGSLAYTLVTDAASGTVSVNEDGSFSYTPDADYNGTDSFTYHVSDGQGGSDTATVTITVDPVNDAPVASDTLFSTLEETPLDGTLSATDVDEDILTYTVLTGPENGTLALNADGSFTYTPDTGFEGADSFTYLVTDEAGATDTATATLTVGTNVAPTATDDSAATDQDTVLQGTLEAVDLDGDVLTYSLSIDAANGTVVVSADGGYAYTPADGFTGTDSFVFQVDDGNGGTDLGTVTITVNAVNTAPESTDSDVTMLETADEYVFTASDFPFTDADTGDSLEEVVIATLPDAGTLLLSGEAVSAGQVVAVSDILSGQLVFQPEAGGTGDAYASFTFQVSDGEDESDSAYTMTVNITDQNIEPEGTDGIVTANSLEGYVFTVDDFGFTDQDVEDVLDSVTIFTVPTAGRLLLDGLVVTAGQEISAVDIEAGKLTFDAEPGATTQDAYAAFTFQVSDGVNIDQTPNLMVVDLVEGNTLPTAQDDTIEALQDTAYTLGQSDFGFADADQGDTLQYVQFTVLPTAGTLLLAGVAVLLDQEIAVADIDDGLLTYEAAEGESGLAYDTMEFTVSDGEDYSDVAYTLTVDVMAVEQITGTNEAETLTGSDSAYDYILGLGGDDMLYGLDGNDTLAGGDGNDTLAPGTGNDIVNGNAGTNAVSYEDMDGGVIVNLGQNMAIDTDGQDVLLNVSAVYGSAYDDSLMAGTTAAGLYGEGGDDTLIGGAGADTLSGGTGEDYLEGGAGGDLFVMEPGQGGIGETLVDFTTGEDTLSVTIGEEDWEWVAAPAAQSDMASFLYYTTQQGDNVLAYDADGTGSGEAVVLVNLGQNTLAETDLDVIAPSLENATLTGTDAAETLEGTDTTNDYVLAQGGDDVVYGYAGDDTLSGGSGADTLHPGIGDDIVNGNDAAGDWVSYDGEAAGVLVDLNQGTATDGVGDSDLLFNIRGVEGTAFGDTLVGSLSGDTLDGNLGDDTLSGGAGDDVLLGGTGADTLTGGTGADTFHLDDPASGDSADTITDFTTGEDKLAVEIDSVGWDFVAGSQAETSDATILFYNDGTTNVLAYDADGTGAGDAVILADLGQATVVETDLDVTTLTLDLETLTGTDEAENLVGTDSADEYLTALGGDDLVHGQGGDDWVLGGDGADTLVGGSGADVLYGGAGADYFVFNTTLEGGTGESIKDFESGTDTILVDAVQFGILGTSGSDWSYVSGDSPVATNAVPTFLLDTSGTSNLLYYDPDGTGAEDAVLLADVGQNTVNWFDLSFDFENTPSLDVQETTYDEAAGTVEVTVALTGSSYHTVTVDYATADGTALAGTDYDSVTGTLTFEPGETVQTFTVDITDDTDAEGDETFDLVFSNGEWLEGGDTTITATITDDEISGITGTSGNDELSGTDEADQIAGLDGNDLIESGLGDDILLGGAGADTLYGNNGTDTLTGGDGADMFRYEDATAWGDVITDFESGTDKIVLESGQGIDFEFGTPTFFTIDTGGAGYDGTNGNLGASGMSVIFDISTNQLWYDPNGDVTNSGNAGGEFGDPTDADLAGTLFLLAEVEGDDVVGTDMIYI